MCTVTFIPANDTIYLTSNRDEKHLRASAVHPGIYEFQTGQLLFPKDADAGGTWISVHKNGNAIVFLNGGLVKHQPAPPYRRSRGLILLDLIDSDHPFESFSALDLQGIEPFTAIIWQDGALFECRWDGSKKYKKTQDSKIPHIWSSVTLYSPEIIAKRETWFAEWLVQNADPNQDDILRFHEFTGDGDSWNDLRMDRDGETFTVSITSVKLEPSHTTMHYLDLKNDQSAVTEFPIQKNHCACEMKKKKSFFHRPFFIRLFNWEYWSFNTVYLPIYPIWIFLCARARSFFFFAASNPSIQNGGFLNESKEDIYAIMPAALYPKTLFFKLPVQPEHVLNALRAGDLRYPLIGKPDSGGRGRGVKTLTDDNEVREYVRSAILNFHIQEYVPYKNEVGIFYHRYPGESNGRITGIVSKKFLTVKGDGVHSMQQILENDKRGIMYVDAMKRIHGELLETVLPAGEDKVVSPYGNHARGSLFLDDTHLADAELNESIDRICKQVKDFYYGRLDIRYRSWEELRKGEALSIIEVNGAGSEPTHMYDPRHSILFAWKEIVKHWFILARVSRLNHKKGYRYLTLKEGIAMFREDKEHSKKLAEMPE